MLVGYLNTNEPIAVILLAVAYCWKTYFFVTSDGRGLGRMDWSTFGLGGGLIILSACLLIANAVGGVLVPGNLRLGHVARVNPDMIFLPFITDGPALQHEWQRYQSPDAFRAMSDLAQMRHALNYALKDKYNVSSVTTGTDPRQPGLNFTYSYAVTGLDFGFQRAPELKYTASGSCVTRYDWFNASLSNETHDIYTIADWPELDLHAYPVVNQTSVPAAIYFLIPTDADERSFIAIPRTANRESPNEKFDDPWYMTAQETIPNRGRLRYRVAGARPVLHCKQIDTYEFRGKSVSNVLGLSELFGGADSKLARLWWDTIFPHELGPAVMARIGNALGASGLASSLQFVEEDQSIDLAEASLTKDLERLVLGSLVYTREIVRAKAATTAEQRGNYTNRAAFNSGNGRVLDEFADFVISSPDVTTMSVRVLIVTPSICLFIWTFIAIKSSFLSTEHWGSVRKNSWRTRYVKRTVMFSATQLYRQLDEESRKKLLWEGERSLYPYVPDVSQKYVCRFSELEEVPASTRKSDVASASQSCSPPPPPPRTGLCANIEPAPACDLSPGAEDGCGWGTDSSQPLVTPSPDEYELVMTQHERPSLNDGEVIHWRQVRNE